MEVNSDRLNAFMGKMVTELGAAMNASLVLLGDKLGLYRALAAKGPMTSSELASATGTAARVSGASPSACTIAAKRAVPPRLSSVATKSRRPHQACRALGGALTQ